MEGEFLIGPVNYDDNNPSHNLEDNVFNKLLEFKNENEIRILFKPNPQFEKKLLREIEIDNLNQFEGTREFLDIPFKL